MTTSSGLSIRCTAVVCAGPDADVGPLRDLHLTVEAGEQLAILGTPAAGTSTLMRVLAGLARPQAGAVHAGDLDLTTAPEPTLARHRRSVGLLLASRAPAPWGALSAREHVELPLRLVGRGASDARERSSELLQQLGIGQLERAMRDLPAREQQLVALGVALAARPSLLLLEEPTSGLDALGADDALQLARAQAAADGATLLVATRDPAVARRFARVVVLRNGRAVAEQVRRVAFSRGEGERVDEFTLVTPDGSLTLSPDELQALGIGARVRVVRAEDHLALRAERPPADREPPWRRRAASDRPQ